MKNYFVDGINIIDRRSRPYDDYGHGTQVAGIILSIANYKSNIRKGSHSTKIMPIKAVKGNGTCKIENIIESIEYAIENGADIINLSIEYYEDNSNLS